MAYCHICGKEMKEQRKDNIVVLYCVNNNCEIVKVVCDLDINKYNER